MVGEEIFEVFKRKMYVDDFLGSAKTVKERVKYATIVRQALSEAAFSRLDLELRRICTSNTTRKETHTR
jgi:hypothetical protein